MKDYFSHDYNSRNDKKIVLSFMKYGLESIGAYWCIVEMLYEEGGYLLLSEYDRITFELRTKNELIKYLIFDSELFKNDGVRFWSETAIDRLKLRSEKSEKARQSIENRWNRKRNTNVLQTNNERNTSKVNENKEKESKITCFSFDDFWNMYDKKLDSKSCKEKYERLSESDRLKIKETLPLYLSTIKDKQYQKHPKTYLNNKNWNDEIFTPKEVIQEKKPLMRMVHYKLFGQFYTHAEKAYIEDVNQYGKENIEFINYVENAN